MTANELRIGSYVNYGNSVKKLDGELFLQLLKYTTPFEPIPLTEEWLLKLGFDRLDERRYDKRYRRNYTIGGFIVGNCFMVSMGSALVKTEYVHQLQNLYFAITGEELTFKSE